MLNTMIFRCSCLIAATLLIGGCVNTQPYDYAAFKQSRPKSLLVLPPLNTSPDIRATNSVLSQTAYPLAEAGYYVIPVAVMTETFRQNGIVNADEAHTVSGQRLREIFGADAALYIKVTEYGPSYRVVSSDTTASATAKLIDLRDGRVIWEGSAQASTAENRNNRNQGLAGLLVGAIVEQILSSTIADSSHTVANTMTNRLLTSGAPRGILYGPRSPKFGTD
jgi:hypothetical protein